MLGITKLTQTPFRIKTFLAASAGLMAIGLMACSNGVSPQITAEPPASAPEVIEATVTPLPLTSTPEPIPTIEPIAEPSATATSEPEPIASSADVQMEALIASTDAPVALADRITEEAYDYLAKFVEDFSPRVSGSEGERAAAEFLADELGGLGYDTQLQEFTIDFLPRDVPAFLLISPEARPVRSLPMTLSGMGKVSAPLVYVGKAFPDEVPEEGLTGKIALIERGEITFEEKVSRVSDAGAIAAVVYNNVAGGFGGTLMNQASIPAVSISQEDGRAILDMLEEGEVEGSVTVQIETRDTQNVVAVKRGTLGDEKVVVIGAHYDSVQNTEAAGDNGTGVTSLIKIAEELQDKEFPFTIRFVLFGVEEIGLFGSRHYVENLSEAEQEAIIAMLNFDAIGMGDASIIGDEELTSKVMEYAELGNLEVQSRPGLRGGGSDHASFQAVGIPSIFFFGSDFSRINSPRDTLEFVEPELMGVQVALGVGLLDILAAQEE